MPIHRLLPLLALTVLAACGGGGGDDAKPPFTPVPTPPAPYLTCSAAGVAASDLSAFNTVCMLTTQGEIVVELYPAKAPKSVENFLKYVNAKLYDNTLYHRVTAVAYEGIAVIQGGGFSPSLAPIATYAPIALESDNGLSNTRGTLAMARGTNPDTAASQFFINQIDNSAGLDCKQPCATPPTTGYAVFGRVIYGLQAGGAVDKIAAVQVDVHARPMQDVVTYWAQQLK